MKRIFSSLLIILTAFLLVGCNSDNTPEPKAAVFHGVEDTTVFLDSTFDVRAGVYAEDEIDGILTDEIEVSGTVDTKTEGVYTLEYSVTNSSKVISKATRKVTVIKPDPNQEIGGITNGDFSDGLNGWDTWFDAPTEEKKDGYIAEYSVEDNKAVIDIKQNSENDQWWGVQLTFKKVKLDAFKSYKLIFTVSSENERYLNYQIRAAGNPTGEINLVKINSEEQTIEREFVTTQAIENGELQFSLGNFKESMLGTNLDLDESLASVLGKVYISNVKIIAGPAIENQAPVIDAKTLHIHTNTEFNHQTGLTFSDDRDNFEFEDIVIKNITDNHDEEDITVDTTKPGVYHFSYTLTDSEGLTATADRWIEIQDQFYFPTFNDFEGEGKAPGWFASDFPGMEFTFNKGELEIVLNDLGKSPSDNMFAALKLAFAKDAGTYEFVFKGKADIARNLAVVFEQGIGITDIVELDTDWNEYTVLVEIKEPREFFDLEAKFFLGTYDEYMGMDETNDILTTIYLKDFEIRKA